MQIQIHQIPKRLMEFLRIPLFLKMFVSISKKDNKYRILSNYAALFQEYINEKMNALSCSLYDETIIKSVFDIVEMDLNFEYVQSYYAQILKTYDTIVQSYFYKIRHVFDGYSRKGTGKICICGGMNFTKKSISIRIYNGTSEAKSLDITISDENGMHMVVADGSKIPINSSVFTVEDFIFKIMVITIRTDAKMSTQPP